MRAFNPSVAAAESSDRTASDQRSRAFCLSVADITTGVVCEGPLDLRVAGAATRFLADSTAPDITLRVATGDLSRQSGGKLIFDSGALWKLHREDDRLAFRFTSPTFGPVPYRIARFSSDFRTGELLLHRPYFEHRGPIYPLEYPLDELVLTNFLAQGRGIEIHGCGVVDRSGAGYLFAGPSGAGKTTLARLWKEQRAVTILSDDRVVLRAAGDRIWMYGTPWHGDEPLASPARVPLAHVFFLQHDRAHRLVPVRGALAAAQLFACSFLPFHSASALDFTLGLLDDVTRTVPCHDLGFAPDPTAIEFIRREAA